MNNYSHSHSKGLSNYSKHIYSSENINKYNKSLGNEFNVIKLKKKVERKIILEKFHTNLLFKKMNLNIKPKIKQNTHVGKSSSNLSLFLTKIENTESNNIKTTSTIESIYPKHSRGQKINLKKYVNYPSFSQHNLNLEIYKKPFSFNEEICNCLEQGKKLNTISNFIDKSRIIRRFKINKEIKKYKLLELKENDLLNYEALEIKLYNQKLAKYYLDKYMVILNDYILYLYSVINKEKDIIFELLSKKNELQLEIIQIYSQINKKEKILEQNKQYKIFLLLLKYNVKDITLIPEEELIKYGIRIKKKEKIQNSINDNLLTKNSKSKDKKNIQGRRLSIKTMIKPKKPKKKRSSVFETDNLLFEQDIDEKSNPKIFDNIDEILYHFEFLDNKLRGLIKNYYDSKIEKIELEKEINEEKSDYEKIEDENHGLISSYRNEINILKQKNTFLERKKNYIADNLKKYKSISQNIIFSKIKKILINIPINIENEFKFENFYSNINTQFKEISIKGKKYNKCLYCLKKLEIILLYFIDLKKKYQSNINIAPLYKSIISELENKKRLEKNTENRYNEIRKREAISEKVIEKNKKIIIISRRKVNKYQLYEDEETRRLKKQYKYENTNYEPWISY